jgi:phospholipase/lecithinase/hemolysin
MKILSLPLAAAFLLTACQAPAAPPAAAKAAPKVTRIVAFGDSFADDGNIFELVGAKPPLLYPKGRFSDGLNFVDAMGEALKVPIANFALGGAVTGPGSPTLRPAGLDLQTRAFLSGGGGPAFPRVSGRFAAGDLVVISIGGNDARRFQKSFGTAPDAQAVARGIAAVPAAAERSVAQALGAVDSLVAAGAKRILFLGGDVGRLPEARGKTFAPIGTAFSAHYNHGVRTALAGYSARGVKATWVDLNALDARVQADPAAYGLAGTGACPRACVTDKALARRYLFHVDGLHFTEAGYRIVARYTLERLREEG